MTQDEWRSRWGIRESFASRCPHALKVGRCAVRVCDQGIGWHDFLDHARMWRYSDGRLFLLAHVYDWSAEKEEDAALWAATHGLSWAVLEPDGWYGHGTTPIRFWYEPQHRFSFGRHHVWGTHPGPGYVQ